jgi:hypothetical protein
MCDKNCDSKERIELLKTIVKELEDINNDLENRLNFNNRNLITGNILARTNFDKDQIDWA